jgi:hypothetical protein
VAFVVSCDAVHYGDTGWGGADYAEFGTDLEGCRRAVGRDRSLAEECLCGPVEPDNLRSFLHRCVDPADVSAYRISWCGRFSVPLGLFAAARLAEKVESRSLVGTLLDYGTSVSEPSIDVEGIGATAPNNFHHFVGYAAVGYR